MLLFKKKQNDTVERAQQLVEMQEKARSFNEQQKEKVDKFFKENPLKYEPGYEICNWLVYKAEQHVSHWDGPGYFKNINELCNRYHIVNIKLGETRIVNEAFLDDLTNSYVKMYESMNKE